MKSQTQTEQPDKRDIHAAGAFQPSQVSKQSYLQNKIIEFHFTTSP